MALTTGQKAGIGAGITAGVVGIVLWTTKALAVALVADAGGPYQGVVDQPIKLKGSASGGEPPYSYAWDLDNDGIYETPGKNPTCTWSEPGDYSIGLEVTDSAGNKATDTAEVTITVVAAEILDFQLTKA